MREGVHVYPDWHSTWAFIDCASDNAIAIPDKHLIACINVYLSGLRNRLVPG